MADLNSAFNEMDNLLKDFMDVASDVQSDDETLVKITGYTDPWEFQDYNPAYIPVVDFFDGSVEKGYIKKSEEQAIIKRIGSGDMDAFKYDPRTEATCLAAVRYDGTALKYIPKEEQTWEIVEEAVKQNSSAVSYVKIDIPDYTPFVQQDYSVFEFVPIYKQTKEMCEIAVKYDPRLLVYVSTPFMTKDIIKIALERDPSVVMKMSHIRDLENFGRENIPDFDEKLREARYIRIGGYNGRLEELSQEARSMYYKKASEKMDRRVYDIENSENTETYKMEVVEPILNKIEDLMKNATPKALDEYMQSIEYEYLTDYEREMLAQTYPETLRYMGVYQNEKICLAAVESDPSSLQYVEKQTPEICMAAVKKKGRVLLYVRKKTVELCVAAVLNEGIAWRYVPQQLVDEVDMRVLGQ